MWSFLFHYAVADELIGIFVYPNVLEKFPDTNIDWKRKTVHTNFFNSVFMRLHETFYHRNRSLNDLKYL